MINTPCFQIDEAALQAETKALKQALSDHWGPACSIGWSVKTNSLPWLLSFFHKEGLRAEVVSGTEYALVRRIGFADREIIHNGPAKDRDIFFDILKAGGIVNVDSHQELDWLAEYASDPEAAPVSVGIRANIHLPGEDPSHFGFSYENGELGRTIGKLKDLPAVRVAGLHMHRSTQSRTIEIYRALARAAVRIAGEYSLELSYVDMGGGFFGGRPDKPSFDDYFSAIASELKKGFDPGKTMLIAEPGISLVSSAFTLHTSVLDTKTVADALYHITDGSRMNLNPQVTRHVYPHHVEYGEANPPAEKRPIAPLQWITGFTCMEYDKLFPLENAPKLFPGDRIIYEKAGGYTLALNPLFIRYLPDVYVKHGDGSITQVREAWGIEEYLQKNVW